MNNVVVVLLAGVDAAAVSSTATAAALPGADGGEELVHQTREINSGADGAAADNTGNHSRGNQLHHIAPTNPMADQFMQLMTGRRQLDEFELPDINMHPHSDNGICEGGRGCCCSGGKIGGGAHALQKLVEERGVAGADQGHGGETP